MDILRINPQRPEPTRIAQARAVLLRRVPVAFPTDTVYGIGVPVAEGSSPGPLFELKGRDAGKAVPLLVADAQALSAYGSDVPASAFGLARRFWPGALTLVVKASAAVPEAFRAQDGSVALRVPAHPIARALIKALGAALATTSANRQGAAPATSLGSLDPWLAARLVLAIDGGPTPGPVPSTVVSCLDAQPCVLREGALPSALLLN
jgi:tRNA threonylcarbamoyl adenosine modification protein (Sua5/YciO/YrdC/YwlC family)